MLTTLEEPHIIHYDFGRWLSVLTCAGKTLIDRPASAIFPCTSNEYPGHNFCRCPAPAPNLADKFHTVVFHVKFLHMNSSAPVLHNNVLRETICAGPYMDVKTRRPQASVLTSRPVRILKLTMSSSPRYEPDWLSLMTSGTLRGLVFRIKMNLTPTDDNPVLGTMVVRLLRKLCPGFTEIRLTWNLAQTASDSKLPHGR